jgi:hypothetical protein
VIEASPALAERELIKLANLTHFLSAAIAARGVEYRTADLCASIGMAIMRQAAERWINGDPAFATLVDDATETLRGLVITHTPGAPVA